MRNHSGAVAAFRPVLCLAATLTGVLLPPAVAQSTPAAGSGYIDPAPHRSGFVVVNAVRLHYLDFGGAGEPVLFLSGAGHTAHVWDEFAPRFTDQFRVLALTRRGFGESEQPHSGYQRATLAEDIRALLDSLGIRRVHLVGHSIAGEEMTRFAGSYPERVGRLVYLDAAYDRIAARPAAQGAPGPGRSGAHGANSGEIFSGSYVALALGLRHPASSAKLERGVDLYV